MSNPFGIQKLKNQNKPQKQTLSITNRYCSTMTNNNDDLFHNDNDILNNKAQSYPTHQINSNQDNNNLNTLLKLITQTTKKIKMKMENQKIYLKKKNRYYIMEMK